MIRNDPQRMADERTTLLEFLDWYRATLLLKVSGLSDEQAREAAVPPSDLNLLGLLRHMADVERSWFRRRFVGLEVAPLYYGESSATGDEDGDLHPGPSDTVPEAQAAWQVEVDFARDVVSRNSLDAVAAWVPPGRSPFTLRWLLVHLIEEYARHCGHADLIRERIDGSTGD